jgi:uncharacterized membrane protein (UPF0127 family)
MEKIMRVAKPISSTTMIIAVGAVIFFFLFLQFRGMSYETATLAMGGELFMARVADSAPKRAQGLSGTDHLEKNEAMLFIMPTVGTFAFWMKDMQYPLDIVWVREGKIIDIATRVPPVTPGISEEQVPRYTSRLPIDAVVEVVAGTVDRLGLKIGDEIKIK